MSDPTAMALDAFVRSISINRDTPHSLFLGAGASVSSGIPSAERCMMEWKGRIFTSANPGLEKQVGHVFLPAVQRRIQTWLDKQAGFPALGAQTEYSFYCENCYPLSDDRRAYFQKLVKAAKPSYGYRLLVLLAEAGVFDSVWTTNFDSLSAVASVGTGVTSIEVGLDTTGRVDRLPRKGELLCVSMHGDYRYDALKNTVAELQRQDADLRSAFAQRLMERTVIVLGYSGRDASVMECLTNALSKKGVGRFFWCGFQSPEPPRAVADLIAAARRAGRQAFYVDSYGFDDTLRRLALQCLEGDLGEKAKTILAGSAAADAANNKPFSVPGGDPVALVKSNCFPVDVPSEVYEFDVPDLRCEGAWAALRETIKGKPLVAGLLAQKVLAVGLVDDVKEVFGKRIQGDIGRSPVADHELALPNGTVTGMFRQAIVRCLAARARLGTDGDELIWEPTAYEMREVYKWKCKVFRAVVVALRRAQGREYLTLMPTVFGRPERGDKPLPDFVEKELKRQILSKQYNPVFNQELERWRNLLFPKGSGGVLEYPPNAASSFKFGVRRSPAFGRINAVRARTKVKVPDKFLNLVQFEGTSLPEPKIVFASKDGASIATDSHPIRGLLANRPYDFALTAKGLDTNVRFGVVCPASEAAKLSSFLAKINQRIRANSKKGYLLDYPGFAEAFGLPFSIPQPNDSAWATCPEPKGANAKEKALSLLEGVRACVQQVTSATSVRLVLVFVPERWAEFADYEDEDEEINLHDMAKAYCVQRGIASQFLRESTLRKKFDCEVMWWLALSLYAKSMRTPWILDGLPSTTAFAGLGFGILRPGAANNGHIVLGCSHIYTSDGLGLTYRLSKIDNPIFRQKNPHLSEEDALKLAEDIRQLFFESRAALPERVVIHKRTPFLRVEREGLLKGLKDVPQVDLVEINVEAMMRCTASVVTPTGFLADGSPVDRGTAILLERFKFLLWVNGNAHPNSASEAYYMGKFRIPAPVMIKKHWGPTDLNEVAGEVLALSKMNWNTFDLYTRLPATIHSSNEIARIGKLLKRFERESYDYRLFI
ncbi:MAG TPA: SIR2 family protein [Nitrospira sp.]|jgi:hypothetical protein|nr:SIR2 family protein [Nitrospira sp.]